MMRKHAPNSATNTLDHLNQIMQGKRSNRRTVESENMIQPSTPEYANPTNVVFVPVYRAIAQQDNSTWMQRVSFQYRQLGQR